MKLDIIGDLHGCFLELKELTTQLGYEWIKDYPQHPQGRKLAFIGDLTDRGPKSIQTAELVYTLVKKNLAYYVPGNHCNKLYRFFLGNNVQITHGLETTVAEFNSLGPEQKTSIQQHFIELYETSPLYQILDDGKLILTHAGIQKEDIGKYNKKVKTFVLYGDITGESYDDGTPIRKDWASSYNGDSIIVYGHTPVHQVRVINRTYNIDTGAVFGNQLTALKYPELETVSVKSSMPYTKEKFRRY
ncbi:bis(5'-nucleosyl)-tetraphosphatase PrpE [Cytobacillus purgationiresistens]|uniref:Protein phosphatase n=1 Tax=Cytobacillus purgationiresistens TaxID=863449 RepID=A0ABU0ACV5_9BACI|nr:bis(5'-nucleosyl)-tetraphosphatase PrpE [Cytobacillus purgationiresistens]MDQ0268714.1 protein phosphatase [Cytobacillus purgationiresistens]